MIMAIAIYSLHQIVFSFITSISFRRPSGSVLEQTRTDRNLDSVKEMIYSNQTRKTDTAPCMIFHNFFLKGKTILKGGSRASLIVDAVPLAEGKSFW